MPLHDWTRTLRWDNFHNRWINELFDWLQPHLPEGYRAYTGHLPALAIGGPPRNPDLHVERLRAPETAENGAVEATTEEDKPDIEIAVQSIEPASAVIVERDGWIVSVIEVVSPGNKDRLSKCEQYTSRYAGYLVGCIHLALIDVVPKPQEFSFADAIAAELGFPNREPLPVPYAISYRYGGSAATGGSSFGIWRRPLAVGAALSALPLPLSAQQSVTLDLDATYMNAARKAYLT